MKCRNQRKSREICKNQNIDQQINSLYSETPILLSGLTLLRMRQVFTAPHGVVWPTPRSKF